MTYRIAINNISGGCYKEVGYESNIDDILATIKELLVDVKAGEVVEITIEEG